MTDEETDSEDEGTFIKRTLTWRSVKCDQLIKKLDERYYMQQREKKRNTKPLKPRKAGSNSERPPPRNAPDWAIICPGSSEEQTSACITKFSKQQFFLQG